MPIGFSEAIPIACLGLGVNIVSAWLLDGGHHHHHHCNDDGQTLNLGGTKLTLEIFEDGVPPRFRVGKAVAADALWAETVRPDGARQRFAFSDTGGVLESVEPVPEPHAFVVNVHLGDASGPVVSKEHAHDAAHQDNNLRAAIIHVMADAVVSVLVIVGLLLARSFGWLWMDPSAGSIGACVIASWAYGLVRDAGQVLLDMNPDRTLTESVRREIEADGDRLTDLHVWRPGLGHLGAVLSVVSEQNRRPEDYRQRLRRFTTLSLVTIEVQPR